MQFRDTYERQREERLPDRAALLVRKRLRCQWLLTRLLPLLLFLALVLLSCLDLNLGAGSSRPAAVGTTRSTLARLSGITGTQPVLSSTQRVSFTLTHAPTKASDATASRALSLAMASQPALHPLQVRAAGDLCLPAVALSDPSQPSDCGWSKTVASPYYSEDGSGTRNETTLNCTPEDPASWPASGANWPATLLYNCNAYIDGTFYCNVPTGQTLQSVTIQCATTRGGTLLACAYTYLTIDTCLPTCSNIVLPQTNPLTGLPSSAVLPDGTPLVCPVPVQQCAVPTAGKPAATDWLFGATNGLLLTTTAADTYGNALVQQFRTFSFALALALLAIPFILAGFQLLRGASASNRANVSELLSRILLAIGMVVVSFYLIQAFIDLESAIASTLFTSIPAPAVATFMPSTDNWGCYTHQFFGNIFNLSAYTSQHAANTIDTPTYLQDQNQITITIMANLSYYILTLLSILLAIQLAVRLAMLNAYIIVSPLTILCSALPGQEGANVTRAWLKGFASLLFAQILQLLVLWAGIQLVPSAWLSGGSTPDPGWVIDLFTKILPITLLGLTLSIPRLLQTPATTMLTTVSSSIGGAITGIILIIRGI
jgi:uncharacterized membrane protein